MRTEHEIKEKQVEHWRLPNAAMWEPPESSPATLTRLDLPSSYACDDTVDDSLEAGSTIVSCGVNADEDIGKPDGIAESTCNEKL